MKTSSRPLALAALVAACATPSPSVIRDASPGGLDASAPAPDAAYEDAARLDAPSAHAAREDAPAPEDAAAGDDAGEPGALLEAATRCAPSVAACDAPPADLESPLGELRADRWLRAYSEDTPIPEHGGRVQIVARARLGGRVQRVLVDGIDLASIEAPPASGTTPPFEWWHVWPERAVAGEPLWVTFHTRDARWDRRTSVELVVETTMGESVRGTVSVTRTDALVSYVTSTEDGAALLVHLRNEGTSPRTLRRLVVDGRDVTESACIAPGPLAPGASALVRVPLCEPARPGDAWSVVAEWESGRAIGVGRVLPEVFPIEAWSQTTDCPFPGGRESALAAHRVAGIDTIYVHGGVCGRCGGCDTTTLVSETLPGAGLRAIVTSDLARIDFPSTAGIAAFATGDESDGELYREDGIPEPAPRARDSQRAWWRHPEVPTFNGAKTNRNIGTFAGMADIQGIDLYVAACAPHITPFLMHPPLRAPFDYLLNARLNHRPGPTWLYAQGLSPVWNRGDPEYSVQPDPPEIVAQAFMAVAAGAKGLMWFQSNVSEGEHAPARWRAIADVNAMVAQVRELLRAGDPIGARASEDTLLVEAIRAERAIVVPVISLDTTSAPDDVRCLLVTSESSVPHWVWRDTRAAVSVEVPPDFPVRSVLEITPDGAREATLGVRVEGRTLTLEDVEVRAGFPARLFVLSASEPL